jgi:DNA-binding NtrC family response regulator
MGSDIQKLRELTERLPLMGYRQAETRVRVLVVEDEKSINRLVLETLEYFGCECASATSIQGAVDLIAKQEFDVLLANIVLKENGEESRVVKAFQEKRPGSLVIIMSSDEALLADYSKLFATLAMPFGIYDLVKKVNEGIVGREK